MVDITIHYGGAAAALTVALALGAFDYAADAAREKSAAELAKIDRDLAAATPDDDLALGAALLLLVSPPLRIVASLVCDTGAILLTLLTWMMEVTFSWIWGSPRYFRTGRCLARVRNVRARIPRQAPPRHGKMLMNLLLPGPTAADIMFSYGRATIAIFLALKMWYCRQAACLADNTVRASSAFARRKLQANVALLERGESFRYYAQALLISLLDGVTTIFLRAIFYPICLVWQIERIAFAWLAHPGSEHPTEIYGRYIDGATAITSLLLVVGRQHLLNPLIALAMKLRYLLRSTAFVLENTYYGLTQQILGHHRRTHNLFGRLRFDMRQMRLPLYQETEPPAEKHDDVPVLLEEELDTETPPSLSPREHEGLKPHGPRLGSGWPSTTNLPVSITSPCRYLLGRRTRPLERQHTTYIVTTNARTGTHPRHIYFLPPSVALLLLRTMEMFTDCNCWSIARLPSYILPEDDVIKWL